MVPLANIEHFPGKIAERKKGMHWPYFLGKLPFLFPIPLPPCHLTEGKGMREGNLMSILRISC